MVPLSAGWLRAGAAGVSLSLKVVPRAGRDSILGPEGEALKVAVAAPPADGKANQAVIALLARSWGLPRSAFAIALGAGARHKRVTIAGDPAELSSRILHSIHTGEPAA
ncbi:MAG: hypothetical protein OHK0024_07990 [Thalassobaculales bacterium]